MIPDSYYVGSFPVSLIAAILFGLLAVLRLREGDREHFLVDMVFALISTLLVLSTLNGLAWHDTGLGQLLYAGIRSVVLIWAIYRTLTYLCQHGHLKRLSRTKGKVC
jgi:hypothetical protein